MKRIVLVNGNFSKKTNQNKKNIISFTPVNGRFPYTTSLKVGGRN